MAPWTHHRVLRLIFAPCAHCLPAVDAANDRKALSQFDQAGPPLPVSVTPAALPDDDPAAMRDEELTAHGVPPAAVEALEEPPPTPAQRAPPPAAVAPLTVGAPPAEEANEIIDDETASTGRVDGEASAPPAEEAAEDADVETASTGHADAEEREPAQPITAAPAQETEEDATPQNKVGNLRISPP